MAIRTFLAIDLDDAVRRGLRRVEADVPPEAAKIRWVDDAQRHVTLKFLGDVDDAQVADVCRTAGEIARRHEPFSIEVGPVQCVPPAGRQVRMVWARVQETTGRLADLARQLNEAFRDMGLPYETRPFSAHVTLGRVRFCRHADALRTCLGEWAHRPARSQGVSEIVVYSSLLTPTGPVYTPMAHLPLGA